MAKRNEFKADKPRSGFFSKLFLTQQQRSVLLKWVLYAVLLLVLSTVQDVLLSRWRPFGATTELVPVGVFLICLAEGVERGSVFSLVAASLYLFSGTPAGYYVIVIITAVAIGVTLFRQSYLQKGFAASMLCTSVAMVGYMICVFLIGLFLEKTTGSRIISHLLTAVYSLVAAPVLYPVVSGISTIGGEAWKE